MRRLTPRQAVAYCRAHPGWRLSLQTHKLLGIPLKTGLGCQP